MQMLCANLLRQYAAHALNGNALRTFVGWDPECESPLSDGADVIGEPTLIKEADHVQLGPTIRRRRLGTDLRRLREARSLRLEDVAARLEVAPSTLSRIETGKAPTRTSYLTVMLDLYGVDDPDLRERMADMAREGQRKGWWAPCEDLLSSGVGSYLGLEAAACAIRCFAVDVVPGLVQTRGYAAAACAASRPDLSADQVRRLAWLATRRREMLADGAELHLVLDEAVLRRTIGPPDVLTA